MNYFLPAQLNPSPTVNGSLHVQLKFAVRGPSLVQSALSSHGFDRQGSGTVGENSSYSSDIYGQAIKVTK